MKVLFFKAPWCSACHVLEPYVPEDIEKVDCNDQPEIADKYHIVGLPVFIAVDNDGNEIARMQTTSIPALENWRRKIEEAA